MKTNPTKDRLQVLCFLTMLRQNLEKEKTDEYCPILPELFIKADLVEILKWLYMNKIPSSLGEIEGMDREEVLNAIGGDVYILSYIIEQWEEKTDYPVTVTKVYNLLYQLGTQTHYLMEKELSEWDEYDHSNYKALCRKAGIPQAMYGIYDVGVTEQEKYITMPVTGLYDREPEAKAVLASLRSDNQYKLMKL
ncbi:hypothetical protein [Chryseobacterium oryctis]|uniref:Uncharacterized protein n=1 Tax=Chryseobacterium oryctis TaxID=2952618 RepID=A0ABT3HIQ2_9FLAO|nr:hypothetical protein [Chryseobacterium oryctis]MCW3159669.1 hypothetical protein [Chryseobacterium oryctis]